MKTQRSITRVETPPGQRGFLGPDHTAYAVVTGTYTQTDPFLILMDDVLDKKDNVLAIKESLLQFGKDSTFVEVETAPQQFEKRLVKTGISDGINIEVVSGINKADKVKVKEPEVEEKKA